MRQQTPESQSIPVTAGEGDGSVQGLVPKEVRTPLGAAHVVSDPSTGRAAAPSRPGFGWSGNDVDPYGIQARRFQVPFFDDGFDSGDLSGWSAVNP